MIDGMEPCESGAHVARALMVVHTEMGDFSALVQERKEQVRRFLTWAISHETSGWSFRWSERQDIRDAATAGTWFPNQWWGVMVFTCFGSLKGVQAVCASFQQPLKPDHAWDALQQIPFERGSIAHHRIQPGHKGAKIALVSACQHAEVFRQILLSGETFARFTVGPDDLFRVTVASRSITGRRAGLHA